MASNDTPIEKRISDLIVGRPDVATMLSSYPTVIPDCWHWEGNNSMLVYHDGRSKRVVRTLFELIAGETLSDGWRPVRLTSCGSRRCINPTHFTLKPHNQNRYGFKIPLPARLSNAYEVEVQEIRELMVEWENPNRETFLANCAAWDFTFSAAALDEAFSVR